MGRLELFSKNKLVGLITASRLELFSKNNKRTCPFIGEVESMLIVY